MPCSSRLIDKPRVVFLREMHSYRSAKIAYYTQLRAYEERLQRLIEEEIADIQAGRPVSTEPPPKVPVHPCCPSRYLTESD